MGRLQMIRLASFIIYRQQQVAIFLTKLLNTNVLDLRIYILNLPPKLSKCYHGTFCDFWNAIKILPSHKHVSNGVTVLLERCFPRAAYLDTAISISGPNLVAQLCLQKFLLSLSDVLYVSSVGWHISNIPSRDQYLSARSHCTLHHWSSTGVTMQRDFGQYMKM